MLVDGGCDVHGLVEAIEDAAVVIGGEGVLMGSASDDASTAQFVHFEVEELEGGISEEGVARLLLLLLSFVLPEPTRHRQDEENKGISYLIKSDGL